MSELLIERAGPLTTVQDLGRPGHAHLAVPPSGALDAPALRQANALVGNAADAAGLEMTFGGLRLVLGGPALIALTGAPTSARIGERGVPRGAPVTCAAGERLVVGVPRVGVRTYLAIAGGVTVPAVLGSRSTDLLSGLGPPKLADGDRLPIGDSSRLRAPAIGDEAASDQAGPPPADGPRGLVRVVQGPRDEWLAPGAFDRLCAQAYTVRPESNRVGARLSGPALEWRADAGELPSEGVVTGSIQVPPDGQPIVLLADHPTTGGYPVIAVVAEDDLPVLAQARPGAQLRFARAAVGPGCAP
jgi:biotin-dependent carboxylase-like uncharacterized protein